MCTRSSPALSLLPSRVGSNQRGLRDLDVCSGLSDTCVESLEHSLLALILRIRLGDVDDCQNIMPDQLAQLLDARNILPDRLVIEITEAAALDVSCEMADILARFRLKGFQLSIDDFGTGYSSLMGLFKTPFNEIIIDKSVVFDLEANEEAKTIVAAIVGLAKSIGLRSCAKGVESQECATILAQLGCDMVQGYLYSKPVPADELDSIIDTYREPLDAKLASIA